MKTNKLLVGLLLVPTLMNAAAGDRPHSPPTRGPQSTAEQLATAEISIDGTIYTIPLAVYNYTQRLINNIDTLSIQCYKLREQYNISEESLPKIRIKPQFISEDQSILFKARNAHYTIPAAIYNYIEKARFIQFSLLSERDNLLIRKSQIEQEKRIKLILEEAARQRREREQSQ